VSLQVARVFFAGDDIVLSFGKCYDEFFIATKSTKRHKKIIWKIPGADQAISFL
jgi:hypothetical protein